MAALSHDVYFTLIDNSPAARRKLLDACRQYLTGYPGELFFACGELEPELSRDVNDRGFDVALHIVFASRADHDLYQEAPRHNQFVTENKPNWKQVRVFDSLVEVAR